MRISVTSNIDEVLGWLGRLHPQANFAVAKALTDTARSVQREMPAQTERDLDRPTAFTRTGFFTTPARKDNLTAVVGAKDKQAEYLRWQVEGGSRAPKRRALRLPTDVQLNEYGNVPAGLIKQLVARAKAGKRATKGQARRFGVSQQVDLFYGDPGHGRPPGIYKRIVVSATQHRLVPIIVFPARSAKYRKRFDFYGAAQRIVARDFDTNFASAWANALATAR